MNKKRFIFTLIIAAAILAGIGICVFLCVIAETPWYILLICALVTVVFSNLNFHSSKGDSEENSLMAFKEYCGVELNIVSLVFQFALFFSYKQM